MFKCEGQGWRKERAVKNKVMGGTRQGSQAATMRDILEVVQEGNKIALRLQAEILQGIEDVQSKDSQVRVAVQKGGEKEEAGGGKEGGGGSKVGQSMW